MYSFYRYVDFGEAEAAFAVYSSCEIPLGLAYGINSTVLQCPKWIFNSGSRYSK
jgi:hypothetical protein